MFLVLYHLIYQPVITGKLEVQLILFLKSSAVRAIGKLVAYNMNYLWNEHILLGQI
jgi:hypothetical protein